MQPEVEVFAARHQAEGTVDRAVDSTEIGCLKGLQVDLSGHVRRRSFATAADNKQMLTVLGHLSITAESPDLGFQIVTNALHGN